MSMSAHKNVIFTSFPINGIRYNERKINGDYISNPEAYSEEFDLKGIGIYKFIGLNINGLTYIQKGNIEYDASTGILKLKGLRTIETDKITIIFNKILLSGSDQIAVSVPFSNKEYSVMGDYSVDPSNYKEAYSVIDYDIKSFIGITADSVLYCHPDYVVYNPTNKTFTVTGIKLSDMSNVTLVYNTESK